MKHTALEIFVIYFQRLISHFFLSGFHVYINVSLTKNVHGKVSLDVIKHFHLSRRMKIGLHIYLRTVRTA